MGAKRMLPHCKHETKKDGCGFCNAFYPEPERTPEQLAKVKQHFIIDLDKHRLFKWPTPLATTKTTHRVHIAPASQRILLPVLPPCKFEGPVASWCHACSDGFKIRHCEHPDADWDFCARQATPREHGRNCQTCTLHAA